MRPLKNIEQDLAKAPVHVRRQADKTVLEHLLRELPQPTGGPVGWRARAGLHIGKRIACLAAVIIIAVTATRLLLTRDAPQRREPAQVATATPSGIVLLTELSLERAYRRGGIQAVEDQCKQALATSAKKRAAPSVEELLAELAGDADTLGGANL